MPQENLKNITIPEERSFYLIRRLVKEHIARHKTKLVIAIIAMVVEAAATAGNAWMMEPVLDKIFLEKNTAMLVIVPLAVLVLALLKGAAGYINSLEMKFIGQRLITDMQMRLYEHLLRCDISYFQQQSSGRLLSRFSNDIQTIRKSTATIINNVIKESFTLVFLVGLMFYNSPILAAIAFIAFPLAVYPMSKLGKKMRKVTNKTQEQLGDYTARLDDAFQGIRVVKAYGREKFEVKRASEFTENIFKLYIKAARIESLSHPTMEILAGFAIAGVVFYGGYQVIHGTYTPGAFFSFITALIMAYKPMKSMAGLNTSIQEGLSSVRRYYSVLDMEPGIQDKETAKPLKLTNAQIVFENVEFSYETEKSALNGISFTVPAGKRVALVGESGGGKSTIMNLIMRFYDPEKGSISISGTDIRDVTIASLRNNMAFVNQETTLFDDTVRANIAYGRPNASEEEVTAAAYAAAAHDFIVELPNGYDTMIGQHGLRLSGGQRQRITIARAMLRNAPILLLDEATSSLDPVSEHQVQLALDRLMKGRTTVVIAHRLSTVMNADIINVVAGGRIIESGTHNELIKQNGEYKKLFDRQFAHLSAAEAS